MREFLGFSGADGFSYWRAAEGAYSWQHLSFVTSLLVAMVILAVYFGRKFSDKSDVQKNVVLIWAAILIDAFEIFKIVVLCMKNPDDPDHWQMLLPLFLCSSNVSPCRAFLILFSKIVSKYPLFFFFKNIY